MMAGVPNGESWKTTLTGLTAGSQYKVGASIHHCTITAPSLHPGGNRMATGDHSLYHRCTITVPLLCHHCACTITVPSRYHHCTITAPSPHHHCTITAPSLHHPSRKVSALEDSHRCHHRTITTPSPHHHRAITAPLPNLHRTVTPHAPSALPRL